VIALFKWFWRRKDLLEEIKYQENYIEILKKRIEAFDEIKVELQQIKKNNDNLKIQAKYLIKAIEEKENIKINQEENYG
jgi:hypothetical protein